MTHFVIAHFLLDVFLDDITEAINRIFDQKEKNREMLM